MSTETNDITEASAEANGKRKGFDIAIKKQELAVEDEGVTFHVTDAANELAYDEDNNPVTWTVCGMNSEAWRRAERWQEKKMREYGGRELTPNERAAIEAEFLARCSKGMTGFTSNGQALPFSTPNATAAIVALPYLKRQIQTRMGNHSVFIKPASVNS
jgi:hypothetical protein